MDELDGIFCINLEDRKERYIHAKRVFDKLKIDVTFYHPKKHKTSGRIGCFESHVNVIKHCYNKNMNHILIFEDDIVDTPSYSDETMKEIVTFLKHNEWIEYFQLGYSVYSYKNTDWVKKFFLSKNIYNNKIIQYCSLLAHSYIVNRNGMERILYTWEGAVYEKDMQVDEHYVEIFSNNSAVVCPILFDQNLCFKSDNFFGFIDDFVRDKACFLYNIQYFYRLSMIRYYRNTILIIASGTITLLILLLIVFRSKARKSIK